MDISHNQELIWDLTVKPENPEFRVRFDVIRKVGPWSKEKAFYPNNEYPARITVGPIEHPGGSAVAKGRYSIQLVIEDDQTTTKLLLDPDHRVWP